MSKIDLSQKEIVFMAVVLSNVQFKLGDAAVAIDVYNKLTPFLPKTDSAVKETK